MTPGWNGGGDDALDRETGASQAVSAIYQSHALGLTRLAFLMVGDRQTAEDVVQEAFCGLYRAWDRMSDHTHALGYVRSSVLNGSRSALRRSRRVPRPLAVPAAADSVVARYVKIRATASGRVLRTVSPPAPYNAFESVTGAADGRTFVLAADWYRYTRTGQEHFTLDQKTPLKFMILRISPSGHTQLSPLSLPGTLTEAQAPTLALSPDGGQLAVAYGGRGKPAVVQVITLASGQVRQWASPPPAATPVLGGPGTWTSDGRTLALGQMFVQPSGTIRSAPTQMRLLDTTAPGTSLAAASRLVTLHGAGSFPWAFITPDGTTTAAPGGYSLFTAHGTVRFLPGVNLGATTPGHQPGELAITPGEYKRWLAEMGSLGVRAVRIYTIHPPAFYQALAAYNNAHAADPIYLIQGVYLPNDIYLQKQNLYDPVATATFRGELRDAVAAVSGKLVRSPRPGFASGRWTTNVSRWTAGWIIGVEWDPFATAATDRRNPHAPATRGRYFHSTPAASPAERWIAARMNDTATALAATGWTAPIAFANWPTADPLRHPNEPNPQEDMAGVDADHVLPTRDWPGGTFASFHAYPYYPDFLRYQPSLQHFTVDGHADSYAGYLHDLLRHFKGTMPVMITEFGVPSSLGSAHDGTLGRSQGNHAEQRAMQIDAKLLLQMRQLGMAGGFVFEWTDEWYKKTWNTQLHQIPKGRVQLWHDMFTNEQYFGIVATDPRPFSSPVVLDPGPGGPVNRPRVTAWEDESCVYLRMVFPRSLGNSVTVGMDTIPAITGPPPPGSSDHRASYALVLDLPRRTGQAWVRSKLDPDQIDYAPVPAGARPAPLDGWRVLELVTDRPWVLPRTGQHTRMRFDNAGLLRYGDWTPGDPGYDSQALWHLRGSELDLRIPWAMAGLSDPSSHQALMPLGEFRATSVTIPGIGVTIAADGGPAQQVGTIRWQNWQAVRYTERIKAGAGALREAFAAVS